MKKGNLKVKYLFYGMEVLCLCAVLVFASAYVFTDAPAERVDTACENAAGCFCCILIIHLFIAFLSFVHQRRKEQDEAIVGYYLEALKERKNYDD